jgi:hypothetical protein
MLAWTRKESTNDNNNEIPPERFQIVVRRLNYLLLFESSSKVTEIAVLYFNKGC